MFLRFYAMFCALCSLCVQTFGVITKTNPRESVAEDPQPTPAPGKYDWEGPRYMYILPAPWLGARFFPGWTGAGAVFNELKSNGKRI